MLSKQGKIAVNGGDCVLWLDDHGKVQAGTLVQTSMDARLCAVQQGVGNPLIHIDANRLHNATEAWKLIEATNVEVKENEDRSVVDSQKPLRFGQRPVQAAGETTEAFQKRVLDYDNLERGSNVLERGATETDADYANRSRVHNETKSVNDADAEAQRLAEDRANKTE